MNDEFDVNVDDDSGAEVASKILEIRKMTKQGDFTVVDEMYNQWAERKNKGSSELNFKHVARGEDDDDTDWDSDDLDGDGDQNMGNDEVPTLVNISQGKVVPRVDEDGFTEVVGRKRR